MADTTSSQDKKHQGEPTLTTRSAGDVSSGDETAREDDSARGLTYTRRGEQVSESIGSSDVDGYDAVRMRDRALLTAEEEKALMRRVDWRIMTVCSLLFLMKNLDADNISNARIMNRDTDRNIMTQLNMSSDQYNLLNVLYYVRAPTTTSDPPRPRCWGSGSLADKKNKKTGPVHCLRGTLQPAPQALQAQHVAVENHDLVGYSPPGTRRRPQQGRHLRCPIRPRTCESSFFYVVCHSHTFSLSFSESSLLTYGMIV